MWRHYLTRVIFQAQNKYLLRSQSGTVEIGDCSPSSILLKNVRNMMVSQLPIVKHGLCDDYNYAWYSTYSQRFLRAKKHLAINARLYGTNHSQTYIGSLHSSRIYSVTPSFNRSITWHLFVGPNEVAIQPRTAI